MLTSEQILALARAYAAATGLSMKTVGRRACGPNNDKVFQRLERGQGINVRSLERASAWLRSNWPENAAWPAEVPGKPKISARPRNVANPVA